MDSIKFYQPPLNALASGRAASRFPACREGANKLSGFQLFIEVDVARLTARDCIPNEARPSIFLSMTLYIDVLKRASSL